MIKIFGIIMIVSGIVYLASSGAFKSRNTKLALIADSPQEKYKKLLVTIAAIIILVGVYLLNNG